MWNKRTVFLEGLGCAKNQVDAELMLTLLLDAGWVRVESPEEAELVLVNSCGFIKSAKEEAIQVSLGFAGDTSVTRARVVMTGCLSQRYGAVLGPDMPELAGFFGNRDVAAIVDYIEHKLPAGGRVWRPDTSAETIFDNKKIQEVDTKLPAYTVPERKILLGHPGSAYVKIAEGCRNRCTFCAIPLIRGDLRSRTIPEVLSEIRALLARGIKEVILIAQDLNAFGRDRGSNDLLALLREIQKLPGDHWIRPLYVYPDTFNRDMLSIFLEDKRFLPYFDMPFQHASLRILHAMARSGSTTMYLDLIRDIRQALPHAALRTSILVGFPGEEEADMDELLAFQEAAQLEWLGVFSYSAEEGTRAAMLKGKVNQKTARERQARIEGTQIGITARRLDRYLGMVCKVLIEEQVEGEELALGRTFFQAPEVDGLTVVHGKHKVLVPGTFVNARLVRRNGVDMEAYLSTEPLHG